jgi:hypothetical protein
LPEINLFSIISGIISYARATRAKGNEINPDGAPNVEISQIFLAFSLPYHITHLYLYLTPNPFLSLLFSHIFGLFHNIFHLFGLFRIFENIR